MIKRLPQNLSSLTPAMLEAAARAREERISPLFRRWPRLSRAEMAELRQLYGERMRVAKQLGRRQKKHAN